ncbi:MAG: hypothetical protein ACOC11_00550 [Prolixibacteraceae bacterium]
MKYLKKNIYRTLVITVCLLGMSTSNSTAQSHIRLDYDLSYTFGNTNDFISAVSTRGGTFGFGHHLSDMFSIGLKVGLHSFSETFEKDVYLDDNVSIYGMQRRYINSFPILLTGKYNLTYDTKAIPYIEIGAGPYYFQMRRETGLFNYTNEYNWNFGFQPEIGLMIEVNESLRLNVNTSYHYILENQSIESQSYFNFGAGIMIYNMEGTY